MLQTLASSIRSLILAGGPPRSPVATPEALGELALRCSRTAAALRGAPANTNMVLPGAGGGWRAADPGVEALITDYARMLVAPEVVAQLAAHPEVIPPSLSAPENGTRREHCLRSASMPDVPTAAVTCMCNEAIPWPSCEAETYLGVVAPQLDARGGAGDGQGGNLGGRGGGRGRPRQAPRQAAPQLPSLNPLSIACSFKAGNKYKQVRARGCIESSSCWRNAAHPGVAPPRPPLLPGPQGHLQQPARRSVQGRE